MRTIQNVPLEIERKFLIQMPDLDWIQKTQKCQVAQITQTYLGKNKEGFGNRIRLLEADGEKKYLHTAKKSLHGFTRIEIEKEVTEEEYQNYLKRQKMCVTLHKTRYTISLNHLKYEIDVYPFWSTTAILEVELKSQNEEFAIPEFLHVIGEVTNNLDYSNHSLAKKYASLESGKKEQYEN